MALTAEQKKKVQDLINTKKESGIPLQQAIKESFTEVGGEGALQSEIERKKSEAATKSAVSAGFSPYVDPVAARAGEPKKPSPEEIKKEGERIKLDRELLNAEASFIDKRSAELKRLGYSDIDAMTQSKKEFDSMFGRTPESSFGEYEERISEGKIPFVGQAQPTTILGQKRSVLGEALLPQVYGKDEKSMDPTRRMQTDVLAAGAGIDWTKIKNRIKESTPDISEKNLNDQINLMKKVYDKNLQIELDKLRAEAGSPLADYYDKKQDSLKLAEDVYNKTVNDMESFGRVTEEKALKDKDKQRTVAGDTLDVAAAALGMQFKPGEGIPDYTPGQMEMFKVILEEEKAREKVEKLGKEKKNVYVLPDGSEISEAEYNKLQGELADTGIKSGGFRKVQAQKKEVLKTEADIDAELAQKYSQTPWYADEEKKKKYLANPEKYAKEGIFTDTTIYGGQRETTGGWLMRSALSPLNAVAGVVSPLLFEGFGEVGGKIAEEKRARRPELYKDSPVLLNIAENRGFFGEGQEVADILDLRSDASWQEAALRYGYLGGTLAADLLDPSLDIAVGLSKGVKAGAQARAASKALGTLAGDTSAIATAAKVAANDILDNAAILALVPKKANAASDARVVATSNITRSLDDSQKAADLIKANPAATAEEVSRVLADSTSSYAKRFAQEAKANPTKAASEIASDLKRTMPSADNLLDKADEISKALDEIRATGNSRLIRSKELARQLGALASTDSRVADAFRVVDSAPTGGVSKIAQYLNRLEPEQFARLRKGLLYDAASTSVYKATKEMSALDNLVAATKNTFVDKNILPDIMKRASDSPIGKIAESLKGSNIKFVRTPKGLGQAFELTEDTAKNLNAIADQLQTFRKLDNTSLIELKTNLGRNVITTDELRMLIDANIDLIAESIATGGKAKVARARDVARLPVSKQLDLLVPLESRAFSREVYKEIWNKLTGLFTKNRSKLSIGQQRLLQEATASASNLDVTLRTKMQDLIGSVVGKLNDSTKEARAAYGIADPTKALTKQEALAHIIVGPMARRDSIESTLSFALDNLFYNKTSRQNIFDLFSGVNLSRNTSTLSEQGRAVFDSAISDAATRIAANPATMWDELIKLQTEYRDLLAKAKAGDVNAKSLFSGSVDEIVDIGSDAARTISAGASRLGRRFTGIGRTEKAIPQEVSVAMFYKAEADRIQRKMLQDLATKEIGKGNISVLENLDEAYYDFAKNILSRYGIRFNDLGAALVSNRIKEILSNPAYKQTPIDSRMMEDIGIPPIAARTDPAVKSVVENLTEMAEDIANSIIRQNDLKPQTSLDDIERQIKAMASGTGKEADNLKLLFGEDVAGQIQENLAKGFDSLKEDLQNSLVRNYEKGQGSLTEIGNIARDLWNYMNDLRYTLLLTFAPRFNGANLLTASDIIYQTTGKLPNMADVATGLGLTHLSRYSPDTVLLKEGFGKVGSLGRTSVSPKTYTAREIYELLSTQGGKSVYSLVAPNLNTKRILELTDDDFTRFNEFWNSLKNAPQVEDIAYRYSVFAEAIRAGRSEDEAIALARKSMFDAADLTSVEKNLQQVLMFYGFARNNFVNFVKNLSDPEKGWKRISQFLKAERNVQDTLVSDEERQWAPGYLSTKMILDKRPYSADKDLYITSPSIATKDAFKVFGELLKGNIFGILQDMANPNMKVAFDVGSDLSKLPTKISPEHVYLIGLLQQSGVPVSTGDIASLMAGSDVLPRKATPQEGAVNGYIYPLTTPEQQKNYKFIVDALSWSGASRLISDFSKSMSGAGTPIEGLPLGEKLAYIGGAITPSAALTPERQEFFNKLGKLQAIKKAVGGMTKEDIKEEVAPIAPPTPEEKVQAEKIALGGTKAARKEIKIDELTDADIIIEIRRLNGEMQGGATVLREKYSGNLEIYKTDWLEPRRARLKELQTELNRRKEVKGEKKEDGKIKVAPIKIAPIKVAPIKIPPIKIK